MAGHSEFANIKYRKAARGKRCSRIFASLICGIRGDVAVNSDLRSGPHN